MSDNQTVYEVIRDIGYAVKGMNHDKILAVSVVKDCERFYTLRTSSEKGVLTGMSETAHAIKKAYTVTRNKPDPRDQKIKELEYELGQTKIILDHKATLLASCEKALEDRDSQITTLCAEIRKLQETKPGEYCCCGECTAV